MIIINYFIGGHDPQIVFKDDSIVFKVYENDELRIIKPYPLHNSSDYLMESPLKYTGDITIYVGKNKQYQLNILRL